jgi:hypothetical protein
MHNLAKVSKGRTMYSGKKKYFKAHTVMSALTIGLEFGVIYVSYVQFIGRVLWLKN